MVTERRPEKKIAITSRNIQEFDVSVYEPEADMVLSWDEFVNSLVLHKQKNDKFRIHMYQTRYALDAAESRKKLILQLKRLLSAAH